MKKYQKTARLIFLYIRQELRFGQERELKHWRGLSEANESFFREETSQNHIRERLRAHEECKTEILEMLKANYPANWVEGAPRKSSIVIRMLKVAAMILGGLFLVGALAFAINIFVESRNPKSFAMMVTVNGQRKLLKDWELGFMAGMKNIDVHRKEGGDLLYIIPNNSKAIKGQSDTLWTSDEWRFELHLPEGSDIWVNLSGTISYPQNFTNTDAVSYYLSGEGYFKIPGNTGKQYEIRTDCLMIRTSGAELDLRSNTGGSGPAILLVSGNASVTPSRDTARTVHLNPGEQARLADGKIVVDEHPDIRSITGWKK